MGSQIATVTPSRAPVRYGKIALLALILLVAAGFVLKYVFRYYLNYNEAAFDDPVKGAANYWAMRGWLLLHITSGMSALLIGPFQFSGWIRKRYTKAHRVSGRVYLIAVACGALAATRLAIGTVFGWAWGVGLITLAFAWVVCSGMAFYAIKQRQIQFHREWMIRSYIVTFGFVTFRMMNDMGPLSHLQPAGDRAVTFIWVCWVVPLLVAEVILQLRRMRQEAARLSR